jgi:hypothetical protein
MNRQYSAHGYARLLLLSGIIAADAKTPVVPYITSITDTNHLLAIVISF